MIIERLDVENFRQFMGKQHIDFAVTKKNVTVIYGANGRGKTGIFRALVFALYGERKLSQDGAISDKEISLVNKTALENAYKEGSSSVDASVRLSFVHRNQKYSINRELRAIQQKDKIFEEVRECKLELINKDGNTKIIKDPQEIEKIINGILDSRVKEYFLFDGEKMERLTRADSDQRRAVANGIRDMLNIDTLTKAQDALGKLKSYLSAEVTKKCPTEYAEILKAIDDNASEQKDVQIKLHEIRNELENGTSQLASLSKKLEEYSDIKHLLESRKTLKETETARQDDLKSAIIEISMHLSETGFLLARSATHGVFESLNQRVEKGEIPPELKAEFVEKLLAAGKCICGRNVLEKSPEWKTLLEWKKSVASEGEIKKDALKVWQNLSGLVQRDANIRDNLQILLQRYATEKHELGRISEKIEQISKKIGDSPTEDVAELENIRRNTAESIGRLKLQESNAQDKLDNLIAVEQKLIAQRTSKEKELQIRDVLVDRMKLAEDAFQCLGKIYNEFTEEIKQQLGDEATKIFQRLIDEESRKTLGSIKVDDKYSLQIVDKWGKSFLANISAGQRQIMSIAFITALAKAAAGGEIFEMPLFMDTPFGRLSNLHRQSLIENLPELCAQWILLATDTEFREEEELAFKQKGKLGEFYVLQPDGVGGTKLRPVKTSEIGQYLS
jgi:DNA sulfur modification protein DndD